MTPKVTDKGKENISNYSGAERPPEVPLAPYWLPAIIESADDAIVSKTLDGIITSWNSAAERIFGYKAHEIIGRQILVLIPPELHDEERQILTPFAVGRAGEPVQGDHPGLAQDR